MRDIDVIVIGELNVDLILNHIASFPEMSKETMAQQMTLTLGSSSAIFASNLSTLGAKVSFIGKIGNDKFGEIVLNSLTEKGVDVSLIQQSTNSSTGATVVLNFDEDRSMVTYPGAMDDFSFDEIPIENLKRAKHLHFSSYFLQKGLKKEVGKLFRLAKESGLTTSLDTQWDPEEKWDLDLVTVLPYVDVFLPNEKEIYNLTNKNTLSEALKTLEYTANTVIVKMGNKGSVSWCKGHLEYREPFLNMDVVDAIGAGDSFNAGFIYKFIQGDSVCVCQEFGNLIGAISTTQAGGTAAFTTYENVMAVAEEKFGYVIEQNQSLL